MVQATARSSTLPSAHRRSYISTSAQTNWRKFRLSGRCKVNPMRIMNLPPFPGDGFRITDLGEYLKTRLALNSVPWPDLSSRLLAYMAWPNDASRRDLWMAALIGTQLSPEKPVRGEGASVEEANRAGPYLPTQNACWEYFGLFGGHMPLAQFAINALHSEIGRIQVRWARVSEILHRHYDMSAGGHMQQRGGASVGKVIELIAKNSQVKGRGATRLWTFWAEFKDVAHLVTAANLISAEAKARSGREGWSHSAQLSPYRVVMLAPEAVLAVGKSLQEYGLEVAVHARHDPLFDPNTSWRIPDWMNVEALAPPQCDLTPSDIRILNARRARRRVEAEEYGDDVPQSVPAARTDGAPSTSIPN